MTNVWEILRNKMLRVTSEILAKEVGEGYVTKSEIIYENAVCYTIQTLTFREGCGY